MLGPLPPIDMPCDALDTITSYLMVLNYESIFVVMSLGALNFMLNSVAPHAVVTNNPEI